MSCALTARDDRTKYGSDFVSTAGINCSSKRLAFGSKNRFSLHSSMVAKTGAIYARICGRSHLKITTINRCYFWICDMRIGYARVSTDDQILDLQRDALKRAKCRQIYEEHASGRTALRPELEACLKSSRKGDTLVVWGYNRILCMRGKERRILSKRK